MIFFDPNLVVGFGFPTYPRVELAHRTRSMAEKLFFCCQKKCNKKQSHAFTNTEDQKHMKLNQTTQLRLIMGTILISVPAVFLIAFVCKILLS